MKQIPKVRLARPTGRPFQLRYTDPDTGREVRLTCNTYDEGEALDQKAKLESMIKADGHFIKRRRANGEGSIFQRQDGRWVARITVGYDEKGKRRRRDIYGWTKEEVFEKARKARNVTVSVVEFSDRRHFQLQWIDPVTTKKKTRSSGIERINGNRIAAEQAARELECQLRGRPYIEQDPLMLVEMCIDLRARLAKYELMAIVAASESLNEKTVTKMSRVDRQLTALLFQLEREIEKHEPTNNVLGNRPVRQSV